MICRFCDSRLIHKRGCPDSRIISELEQQLRIGMFYLGRDKYAAGQIRPTDPTQVLGWDAEACLSRTILKRGDFE